MAVLEFNTEQAAVAAYTYTRDYVLMPPTEPHGHIGQLSKNFWCMLDHQAKVVPAAFLCEGCAAGADYGKTFVLLESS